MGKRYIAWVSETGNGFSSVAIGNLDEVKTKALACINGDAWVNSVGSASGTVRITKANAAQTIVEIYQVTAR